MSQYKTPNLKKGREIILEEIAMKTQAIRLKKNNNYTEPLYPVMIVYNHSPHYARLNFSRDYIWHDDMPPELEGKSSKDLYQIMI